MQANSVAYVLAVVVVCLKEEQKPIENRRIRRKRRRRNEKKKRKGKLRKDERKEKNKKYSEPFDCHPQSFFQSKTVYVLLWLIDWLITWFSSTYLIIILWFMRLTREPFFPVCWFQFSSWTTINLGNSNKRPVLS